MNGTPPLNTFKNEWKRENQKENSDMRRRTVHLHHPDSTGANHVDHPPPAQPYLPGPNSIGDVERTSQREGTHDIWRTSFPSSLALGPCPAHFLTSRNIDFL
ncbi:unnamed protein product [Penicillium pancosmium]